MTTGGTKALTLTELSDARREQQKEEETIPERVPQPAEVIPPLPGEASLPLSLTLREIGAITACVMTSIHSGWVRERSNVDTCNSVLRKLHDAKLHLKANPV